MNLAYQLFALLFAALFVHAIYVTAIRPEAETLLAEQRTAAAADENYVPERHLAVVLRDFEQEACFILMLWAMAIMGRRPDRACGNAPPPSKSSSPLRAWSARRGRADLAFALSRTWSQRSNAPHLPRALSAALQRFAATRNVQDVSEAVRNVCDAEGGASTPNCPWCATLPGPSPPSGSLAPSAASGMR